MYASTDDFASETVAFKLTWYDPCMELARFCTFETGLVPEQKIFQGNTSGTQQIQIFDNDESGYKTVEYEFIDSEGYIEIQSTSQSNILNYEEGQLNSATSVCGRLEFSILGVSEFENFVVSIEDELEAILTILNLGSDSSSFV